mgnify:FL=1
MNESAYSTNIHVSIGQEINLNGGTPVNITAYQKLQHTNSQWEFLLNNQGQIKLQDADSTDPNRNDVLESVGYHMHGQFPSWPDSVDTYEARIRIKANNYDTVVAVENYNNSTKDILAFDTSSGGSTPTKFKVNTHGHIKIFFANGSKSTEYYGADPENKEGPRVESLMINENGLVNDALDRIEDASSQGQQDWDILDDHRTEFFNALTSSGAKEDAAAAQDETFQTQSPGLLTPISGSCIAEMAILSLDLLAVGLAALGLNAATTKSKLLANGVGEKIFGYHASLIAGIETTMLPYLQSPVPATGVGRLIEMFKKLHGFWQIIEGFVVTAARKVANDLTAWQWIKFATAIGVFIALLPSTWGAWLLPRYMALGLSTETLIEDAYNIYSQGKCP